MAINRLQLRRDSLEDFQNSATNPNNGEPLYITDENRIRVGTQNATNVGKVQNSLPITEGIPFHGIWNCRAYGTSTAVNVPAFNGAKTNGDSTMEPLFTAFSGALPRYFGHDAGVVEVSASGDYLPGSTDPAMLFGFAIGTLEGDSDTIIGASSGFHSIVGGNDMPLGRGYLEVSGGVGMANCLGDYNKPVLWNLDAKVCFLGRDSVSPFKASQDNHQFIYSAPYAVGTKQGVVLDADEVTYRTGPDLDTAPTWGTAATNGINSAQYTESTGIWDLGSSVNEDFADTEPDEEVLVTVTTSGGTSYQFSGIVQDGDPTTFSGPADDAIKVKVNLWYTTDPAADVASFTPSSSSYQVAPKDNANVRVYGTLTIMDPFVTMGNNHKVSVSHTLSVFAGANNERCTASPAGFDWNTYTNNAQPTVNSADEFPTAAKRGAIVGTGWGSFEAMGAVPGDSFLDIRAMPSGGAIQLNDKIERLLNAISLQNQTSPGTGHHWWRWWRPRETVVHFSCEEYVPSLDKDENLFLKLKVGGPMQSDTTADYEEWDNADTTTAYPSSQGMWPELGSGLKGVIGGTYSNYGLAIDRRWDYEASGNAFNLCRSIDAGGLGTRYDYVCRFAHKHGVYDGAGTQADRVAHYTDTIDDTGYVSWYYEDPEATGNADGEWNCAWRRLSDDRRDHMRIHHSTAFAYGGRPGANDFRPL